MLAGAALSVLAVQLHCQLASASPRQRLAISPG